MTEHPETAFKNELEIFRKEESVGQQYFFAWLQIRSELAADEKLLDRINETPLFWITTHHALLLSAFVALGRVFDQDSKHNIDSLLRSANEHRQIFTRDGLKARKIREGLALEIAAEYVSNKYEYKASDFRVLRKEVAKRRALYTTCFRDVRRKIFAHKELSDPDAMNALFAKARIDDLKSVFCFLEALHTALWELLHNGRPPVLNVPTFTLPPSTGHGDAAGEIVARHAHQFLRGLMDKDRQPR